MDQQKQPTGLFVALILCLMACYVLSLGPTCWLSSRFGGEKVVTAVYRPLTFGVEVIGNERLMEAVQSYSEFGASESHLWTLSADVPGHAQWEQLFFWFDLSGGSSMLYPLAPEEPPDSPSSP